MVKNMMLDPKTYHVENLREMDELTATFADQLDESSSPVEELRIRELLYETSQRNKERLSQDRVNYHRRIYIDALMEHGWTLKKEDIGSYQMASIAFKKTLRIETYNPLAHYRLAHIAAKTKSRTNEALFHFMEALKQNSQDKDCLYKLSQVQVANAQGMAIKLFTDVMGSVSFDMTEMLGQILESSMQTLRDLVQNVSDRVVIHIQKHGALPVESSLNFEEYLDLKTELENETSSLVLDKIIPEGSLSYRAISRECDRRTMNRLLALLEIDRLSAQDLRTSSGPTLSKHMSRLREKLRDIGVDELKFDIIVPPRGTPYCETSLDIHYFKKIFD